MIMTLDNVRTFREAIHAIVKNIPEGSTLTYKEVAVAAGRPKAFRAVGNILNKNYDPSIPCHRVIRSDGKTGGYNRGAAQKIAILKLEKMSRFDINKEYAKICPWIKLLSGKN